MEDPTHTLTSPAESLDLDTIRSGVSELTDALRILNEDLRFSDSEELLKDCALNFQKNVEELVSEFSDVSDMPAEDYDAFLEHLEGEITGVNIERAKLLHEIEILTRTSSEDSIQLERNLEGLRHSLDLIESQEGKGSDVGCSADEGIDENNMNLLDSQKLEIIKLNYQIEKNESELKSIQDLESSLHRFEAIEKIEDALTGIKVHEFEGNCIRLSLRTYIPKLDTLLLEQKVDDINEPSEVNHEMLIEVTDQTLELKKAEIVPNDVYIGDIIDAAKSFRMQYSDVSLMEPQSSLGWFVRKVQDRIILCSLRRFVVKTENNLRHSFEYLDRDEMIVAHIAGGVEAVIKMPQAWPISNSILRLMSLKSSEHGSKGISLNLFCKIEEALESLETRTRQSLSHFTDAIEEILLQKMRVELHSDPVHTK